jgi:hypothetical protein
LSSNLPSTAHELESQRSGSPGLKRRRIDFIEKKQVKYRQQFVDEVRLMHALGCTTVPSSDFYCAELAAQHHLEQLLAFQRGDDREGEAAASCSSDRLL